MAIASDPQPAVLESFRRKLTTILSADVAGYSRLMAEDEEATLATFHGHRQVFQSLVAEHRGRIFNTAGDAILAEFASTVEAVRCATEIQSALRTCNDKLPVDRRVEFRIGVNLGDVMVQGGDLLGDGVNVAARLQAAAEPGGICISGSVYDQIRNKLSLAFRAMGEQNFKNIPQPVRTFAIAGADGAVLPSRRRSSWRRTWIAAAVVLAAAGAGFGVWRAKLAPPAATAAATGEEYAGPLCYGPGNNDEARCFRAHATVTGRAIAGEWPGAKGGKVILNGEVSDTGAAKIEIHGENPDGSRLFTIDLTGHLEDGKLEATGAFRSGRTATLNWRRAGS